MFSFNSCIVLALMIWSLIHFELIFICGVKQGSGFILLHMDTQFSQHHLLKRHYYFLKSFQSLKTRLSLQAESINAIQDGTDYMVGITEHLQCLLNNL